MASTSTFGPWLKARRKEHDLTREQLAQQIGCAEVTLQKIEQGQRRPSQEIAALLAQSLSIPEASRDDFIRFARGESPPTNLPAPLTSFVERAQELAEVRHKLLRPDPSTPSAGHAVRLLTLVGPPGIGKTRLSIQAAQTLLEHFDGGTWFVDLAPISDAQHVLNAIARVFGIIEEGTTSLTARLQDHLRSMEVLLVLDNFEHVVDAAPDVTRLLKACAKVKVLATSREPLHAYGEHIYPMPALSLPPPGARLTAERLAQFDAIKLFVARADAVQPGFALDAGNAQIVADLCARLDGLPLAIELAAAQLRRFTPQALLDALQTAPLQSLAGAARDVEPRQRTMRAAIQWSYDLLPPVERAVFDRLGIFAGGWTSDAALAVCQLADDAILHALADRSLIKRSANDRWAMLEMIREFALEALAQLPEDELEQIRLRHAEHYAQHLEIASRRGDVAEFFRIVDIEQHNARAALRWLIDHKNALAGVMALFMSHHSFGRCLQTDNWRWLTEVLSADLEFEPPIQCSLLIEAAHIAWQRHDFPEVWRYGHKAVAVARAVGSQPLIAATLTHLSLFSIETGDYVQAKTRALEVLDIGRSTQDPVAIVGALAHLGEAELTLGDMDRAATCFEEAYALCQDPNWLQHVWWLGLACKGVGEMALIRREYDRALKVLREGLQRTVYTSPQMCIMDVLAGAIGTMPRRTTADVQRAAKIWGATQALREKMGTQIAPGNRKRINALIAEALSRTDPKKFAVAWAEGRELSLDEAIALAME
jgi:predicted ATPase/transcriptional regulator with XRE-family HTH domain